MNDGGARFFGRSLIVGALIAATIFATTLAHAQRMPIGVEPSGATAGVTAQSLINRPGSYVLVRNLVNGSKNGGDAIDIVVSNVTLDLQGFTISSTSSKSGAGINATGRSNVVIRNGIITGSGGPAIIVGPNSNISGITASGNSTAGISNASIQAGNGSQLIANSIIGGFTGGITCGIGCLARDNIVQSNASVGMTFSDATSGYLGNMLQGNNAITVVTTGQVSGGTSLNQNVCNGAAC
jgi:hypothetical protein